MAVLSTVIGRGLESAKPGSPAEGYIYYSTDTGALERYSGSAWEAIGNTPATMYSFSTTTTDGDPGSGTIRFNNAVPGIVTEIYIDDVSEYTAADLSAVFQNLDGAYVFIHQADNEAKFLLATIDSSSNETPSYTKWGITVVDSGTLIDDGALVEIHFYAGGGGGGGGSTTLWWDDPKANVIAWSQFHDGDVVQQVGQAPHLLSGTIDNDGQTGAGGYTEDTVACSTCYDTTPVGGGYGGYDYFDQDIPMGCGQYVRTSVRIPHSDDVSFLFGFAESSQFDENGLKTTGEGMMIRFHGNSDTNFQVVHNDGAGGAQVVVDSGVAWAAGSWFNLEIYIYNDGGTMTGKAWINGTLVATTTTQMPAAATITCRPFCIEFFVVGGATATYDMVFFVNHMFWASADAGELDSNGWATSLT